MQVFIIDLSVSRFSWVGMHLDPDSRSLATAACTTTVVIGFLSQLEAINQSIALWTIPCNFPPGLISCAPLLPDRPNPVTATSRVWSNKPIIRFTTTTTATPFDSDQQNRARKA